MAYVCTFVYAPSPHLDLDTELWAAPHADRLSFICFLILNCLWKIILVWHILLQRLSHCTLVQWLKVLRLSLNNQTKLKKSLCTHEPKAKFCATKWGNNKSNTIHKNKSAKANAIQKQGYKFMFVLRSMKSEFMQYGLHSCWL